MGDLFSDCVVEMKGCLSENFFVFGGFGGFGGYGLYGYGGFGENWDGGCDCGLYGMGNYDDDDYV